jgi:inhibitor of KinA
MYRISENAITLAWEEKIDIDIHRQVMLADELISNFPFAGWIENVPGFHTLTIFFNPFMIARQARDTNVSRFVEDYLDHIIASPERPASFETRRVRVPVCYDPQFGLDLQEVSGVLKIGIDEIVREHCSTPYHVFMLGFLPGFPYMGMLPDVLKIPRKAVPAIRIPLVR